jgi:O-antigen/teichoic acid export membrane protein
MVFEFVKMIELGTKFYSLTNQIIASAFSFSIVIIASRLLNSHDFGVMSIVIMVSLLVAILPQSFVTMPIMSNTYKHKDMDRYFFYNIVILLGILVFIGIILSITYAINLLMMQNYFSLLIVLGYFIVFQIYEFIKRVLFVKDLHRELTFYEIVKAVIFGSFLFAATYFDLQFDIDLILISLIVSYLVFILIIFKHIRRSAIDKFFFLHVVKENYHFGKWIFTSNTIQNLSSNIYMYIAALLLPLNIIGALNAVRSLVGFSTVIFLAIDNYLTPKYAQFYNQNSLLELEKMSQKIFLPLGYIFIFFSIGVGLFAEDLLGIVYGNDFKQYGYYLYYFLAANLLMFYTRPLLLLSKTIGLTKIMFFASIPTLLFSVIMTYPVVAMFHVDGALFIMLITQAVHLFGLHLYYKRLTQKDEICKKQD